MRGGGWEWGCGWGCQGGQGPGLPLTQRMLETKRLAANESLLCCAVPCRAALALR